LRHLIWYYYYYFEKMTFIHLEPGSIFAFLQ